MYWVSKLYELFDSVDVALTSNLSVNKGMCFAKSMALLVTNNIPSVYFEQEELAEKLQI